MTAWRLYRPLRRGGPGTLPETRTLAMTYSGKRLDEVSAALRRYGYLAVADAYEWGDIDAGEAVERVKRIERRKTVCVALVTSAVVLVVWTVTAVAVALLKGTP